MEIQQATTLLLLWLSGVAYGWLRIQPKWIRPMSGRRLFLSGLLFESKTNRRLLRQTKILGAKQYV